MTLVPPLPGAPSVYPAQNPEDKHRINMKIDSFDPLTKIAVSVLVYDRQALLKIRLATKKLVNYDLGGQKTFLPSMANIPAHLYQDQVPLPAVQH